MAIHIGVGGADEPQQRAGEFVTEPIAAEEEIDPALDRLREAIASELADGRQVRLQ